MSKHQRGYDFSPLWLTTPPTKRARFDLAATDSPSRSRTSCSPFTDYSRISTPYSIPSDSPSNPFGLQRTLAALTLPPSTPFGRHIALRFQLVYDRSDGAEKLRRRSKAAETKNTSQEGELDGVYRIVQVPKNYTFRHLHKLILFLFASDARWEKPPGTKVPTRQRRSARLKTARELQADVASETLVQQHHHPTSVKGKGKARENSVTELSLPPPAVVVPADWPGHSFEVRDDITLYRSSSYKPGVIRPRSGHTRVRLSSVRDRKLFPDLYEEEYKQALDADVFGSPCPEPGASTSAQTEGVDDTGFPDDMADDTGWTWEAEDDYTLMHVWPHGPSLDRGIIYHHLPGVFVHITSNTVRVPVRKGRGNEPYVFRWRGSARGAIQIAHLAPHNDPGSYPASSQNVNVKQQAPDTGQPTLTLTSPGPTPALFEDENETSEQRLKKWNASNAFARFLVRETERERALQQAPRPLTPASTRHTNTDAAHPYPLFSSPLRRRTHPSSLPPSSPPADVDAQYALEEEASSPITLPHLSSAGRSSSSAYSAYSYHSAYSSRRSSTASLTSLALASLPTMTPAPAHPALARRVARASKRLERLTRDGLKDMNSDDEEEGEVDAIISIAEALSADVGADADADGVVDIDVDADGEYEDDDGYGLFGPGGERGKFDWDDDVWNSGGSGIPWIGKGRQEDWDPFGEAELCI